MRPDGGRKVEDIVWLPSGASPSQKLDQAASRGKQKITASVPERARHSTWRLPAFDMTMGRFSGGELSP